MLTFLKKPVFYIVLLPLLVSVILMLLPEDPVALKEKKLKTIEKNLDRELQKLTEEAENLIIAARENRIDFSLVGESQRFPFVIYKNDTLVYWNNYHVVPEYRHVMGDYNLKFLRLPGGQYLSRKWKEGEYEIVGLLQLYQFSRIENQYVSAGYNDNIFPFTPERILEATFETGYKICIEDNCLFQIAFESAGLLSEITLKDRLGTYLFLISWIIGVWLILFHRRGIYQRWGVIKGLLSIVSFLAVPRLLMLMFDFPRIYLQMPLFDTTAFASSWLNPTLGDLLLNLIMVLIIVILFFELKSRIIRYIKNSRYALIWLVLLGMIYLTAALLLYLVIQTIYNNSQISLDITQNLSFDWLRITAYVLLLIITIISFLTGHVLNNATHETPLKQQDKIIVFAAPVFTFFIISLIENVNYITPVFIAVAIVLITVYTKLYKSLLKIRFASFIYIFSWAVAASLIIAFAIMELERKKEYNNQVRFAEKFLVENDALAEFLLLDINQKIENDKFIQNRLSSPYLGKDVVKDKIRQVFLGGYFDKYDVRIYLFDAQGQAYNSQDFTLRPSDIRMNNKQHQTAHNNIYYIDNPDDELAGRYLDIIELKKRGLRVGYILLDLQLKKIIPANVYPELLVDHRFLQPFQNKQYSYTLLRDGQFIYTSGKFDYEGEFENNLLQSSDSLIFKKGIQFGGYQHRAIEDSEGNVYIISTPAHDEEHYFSNFSFFFLLVVFVVMVVSLAYAIYFLIRGSELYYSARIQLYLSLAFFIPMLIVTIFNLNLVSSSFKEEVNREYEEKAATMAGNIADELSSGPYESQLINTLLRASKYANADANIFSPDGKLLATSQPMIYENNLLATYINPLALVSIRDKNRQMFTANEVVGKLNFNTTYYSIRAPESGNILGILSVPYFESEAALDRSEIEIFTNIINIFTLIFILFLLVSYLASEYLTFPLKIITKKLQKTSLEFNEPLSWEANDEIGLMVREYNKMVMNLEESKNALARTEKESAWREMAQQVAHEIKNPLTPMKLTLQHMQRTIGGSDKDERIQKSLNTLLHQVDTLSEIAGSFSSFARMPAPGKERFDLQKLIQRAISLFTNTKDVELNYEGINSELIIEADEQLMGRIFSNVIINAIEAGEGYHPLKIMIKTEIIAERKVRVQISDNGPGIGEAVREKIFMPHFSTKKTGSGIGLAIARRGIEHAGGEIWFETEEGKGTTFFILLPLADA